MLYEVITSVVIPYMGSGNQDPGAKPERDELSLLEVRGDNFVADRFDALSLSDGLLTISKLPRPLQTFTVLYGTVITSYSIHYTKLYERWCSIPR